MKLFRKKSSPKEGNKQKRSSRAFDARRRASASNAEEKYSLLDSVASETRSQVSNESTCPPSMTSPREVNRQRIIDATDIGGVDSKSKDFPVESAASCAINAETMRNGDKYEIMQFSEALDAADSSAKTQRGASAELTVEEVVDDRSKKTAFSAEKETREDPPGDQNFQYEAGRAPGDQGLKGVLKNSSPTPRKTPTKNKIMGFLRSPRQKKSPSKATKADSLNTTIETSPSSDSEDPPATSTINSPLAESRDSVNEPVEKKAPVRKGPVEITNVNLSRLIKHKNTPKRVQESSVLKPMKANRSRPPAMSMSKRNEEQFQRYIQRQNRGRKVRENQFVPSFH